MACGGPKSIARGPPKPPEHRETRTLPQRKTTRRRTRPARHAATGAAPRGRARLPAADRRQAILEVAKALFLADGYERTTMRRIAAQVRVTPTTLYVYFPDKQALLREITNESFAILEQALRRTMAADLPPLEAFSRMLDVYVEFGLSHPREYRFLLMTEVSDWVPPGRADDGSLVPGDDVGMRALAFLEQQITRLMDAGLIRRASPSTVAEAVWAAAHGLVSLLITFPDFPWSERQALVETVRLTILEGLCRSSE